MITGEATGRDAGTSEGAACGDERREASGASGSLMFAMEELSVGLALAGNTKHPARQQKPNLFHAQMSWQRLVYFHCDRLST